MIEGGENETGFINSPLFYKKACRGTGSALEFIKLVIKNSKIISLLVQNVDGIITVNI